MKENKSEYEAIAGQKNLRIGIHKTRISAILEDALSRTGTDDVRLISHDEEFENLDMVVLDDSDTSEWRMIYDKCDKSGIPLIFLFNFGIGACLAIARQGGVNPDFISDRHGRMPWKCMLDYTRGFNAFFNVINHGWLDSVEGWLEDASVSGSIGVYSQAMAAAHVVSAILHGAEIEYYPKFYLLSMVNQH